MLNGRRATSMTLYASCLALSFEINDGAKVLIKAYNKLLVLIVIVFITACAKQMPPPGGPIDTIAPEVGKIMPSPGETNVATRTKIEIVFSEGMNHKSVENAIFISPWPSEEMTFRWRGRKLRIEFGDTLKADRTYVLTIGAKSSDLRNNQMKDSFSMAFSTGDRIDEGQISGMVYSPSSVEGALVCAYWLEDSADVDPAEVLADYYTQCSQTGKYQLMYIAPGKYRLFAIRDRDGNRKYTRGIDALGVTTSDVVLTPEEKFTQDVNFQLTVEDTIRPSIKSGYSMNRSNILVRFSEAILDFDDTRPQDFFKIEIESDTTQKLNIISCFKNTFDPANIFLSTDPQKAIRYKLITQNLYDLSRNPLDSTGYWVLFEGSAQLDTVKPIINFRSIQDSGIGIGLKPEIRLGFSEAIDRNSFERSFVLKERDSILVSGKFYWKNPIDVSYLVDSSLKSLTQYDMHILIDSVVDLAGNRLADSVAAIHFKTLNEDTLSEIGGGLVDALKDAKGKIYLTAKSEKNSYPLILDKPGAYRFKNILPGIYTINGFRDADTDGVYSFGKAIPYAPAERFFFYPDSIKVRSRWPNEGNNIQLK